MKLRYDFGPFELDAHTLELRRDGVPVPLEPRPATLLVTLVERAGEMVTRRELRERGWPRLPDAADASLNTCIRQIRDALGDDPARPRYIETLRGRGYRFAQPVERVDDARMPESKPRRRRRQAPVRYAAVLAVAFGSALAAVGVGRVLLLARTDETAWIAIPEPRVLGDVPQGDGIGPALAAELRASLATTSPDRIRVLGRETTERLRAAGGFGPDAAVPVTHVLELMVQPRGNALRIVAQLLDVDDGRVVWGDGIYATTATLGAASAAVTGAAAGALGAAGARIASSRAPLDARAHLLKARYVLETHGDPAVALAHVDTVVQRYPDDAEAYGLRAETLVLNGRAAAAREAAARGLVLDPGERGALRAMAWLHMLDGEWPAARHSLDDALRLAPNDPVTLSALAFLLTVQGEFAEAARVLDRSLAADPLAPLLVTDAGLMYYWAGRTEEAVQACSEAATLRPGASWAIGCAFDAEARAGRTDAAAVWGRRLLAVHGAAALLDPVKTPAQVLDAVRRWRVQTRQASVAAGEGDPYALALAYADAGRPDDALDALERAAAAPGLGLLTIAVDPRLHSLRDDDRYRAILDRWRLRRPG